MSGPLLTSWTIRLALAAYALWLGWWLAGGARPLSRRGEAFGRGLYTLACILFLLHVICAFHFYHHWSHRAAFDDTARQTEELLGVPLGEGIYFSYLFLGVWMADALWMWASDSRPRWLTPAVQLYMAFIAFNGAVIFESGITRWIGIPVTVVLAGLAARRIRRRPTLTPDS